MANDVIAVVDVSAATGNSDFNINQGWVRFYNHSINGLQIQLSDGEKFYLPPQARRIIQIDKPNSSFSWTQILVFTVNSSTPVSTKMVVEAFSPSDPLTVEDLASLGGVGNIGNSGVGTTAQYLKDDTDVAGTVFLEARPSGATTASMQGTVDGQLLIGAALAGSSLAGFVHNLILGQGAGAGSCNILPDNPSGSASTWSAFGWNGSAYNRCAQFNNDGSITYNLGTSIGGWSRFTGAASGTYSHGLGAAPSWCGPMQSVAGSSTYGFDTAGATTVHITSGAGSSFACLCTKI